VPPEDEPRLGMGGELAVAASRAAQEVQAAVFMAKRFPRDETRAFNSIMQSCKRAGLAEQALYAYPKGGTTVTGPSIRMAEVLARAWGNIDFGIKELDQQEGESSMMAYAWDLETNARQTKVFTVRHIRHTRKGQYALTDPREIYEMTANQGARRLRACILGIIPGDITEAAVQACEKTMAGKSSEPIADRIRKMVVAFGELAVTQEMVVKRLGHKLDRTSETELVGLRKVYLSLKDNMASVETFFPPDLPDTNGKKRGFGFNVNNTQAATVTVPYGPSVEATAPPERQPGEDREEDETPSEMFQPPPADPRSEGM